MSILDTILGRKPDPWRYAPAYALALRDQQGVIIIKLETIMASQADVKAKLDALTANVADETTKIAGIETVLDNLATIIADLKTQVANADVPQAIVDQIDALDAAIGQNKQRIVDDINKNTPQTP